MQRSPALIVVDVQRDFCPGGALPVKNGDEIVEPINRLTSLFEKQGLQVYFTRDWHPKNHISFRARGGPWPSHCVKNTTGAEFHPSLFVPKEATVISKGTNKDTEAYSGFQGTDLAKLLEQSHIGEIYVTGLATDYCVKETVLDGLADGLKVNVVEDCVMGVNVNPTDSARAIETMITRGASKTTSTEIIRKLSRRVAISSSS